MKKKNKSQPKYGLGYKASLLDDEEEILLGVERVCCYNVSTTNGGDASCSYKDPYETSSFDAIHAEEEEIIETTIAPQEVEDGGQPTIDELVQIKLGTEEDPRPTFVSATLTLEERESYNSFLMKFRDCFAWTYKEMPGLNPRVATHKLVIDP